MSDTNLDDYIDNILKQIEITLANLTHSLIQTQVEEGIGKSIRKRTDKQTEELLNYAKEVDIPEVGWDCPFCDKSFDEHEETAYHMAEEHTEETARRYANRIDRLYEHPDEVSNRYRWVVAGVPDQMAKDYFCPFCGVRIPGFRRSDLKRHVTETHAGFMELFTKVILGGNE